MEPVASEQAGTGAARNWARGIYRAAEEAEDQDQAPAAESDVSCGHGQYLRRRSIVPFGHPPAGDRVAAQGGAGGAAASGDSGSADAGDRASRVIHIGLRRRRRRARQFSASAQSLRARRRGLRQLRYVDQENYGRPARDALLPEVPEALTFFGTSLISNSLGHSFPVTKSRSPSES